MSTPAATDIRSEGRPHDGPPRERDIRIVLEREVPGDEAFVVPLTFRAVEVLLAEGLIGKDFKEKAQICITEALRNAVYHGSCGCFSRRVRLTIFAEHDAWGVLVEDEGDGFDPDVLPDPNDEEGVWGESGRGLSIIRHYMDRVEFFRGGAALLFGNRK